MLQRNSYLFLYRYFLKKNKNNKKNDYQLSMKTIYFVSQIAFFKNKIIIILKEKENSV